MTNWIMKRDGRLSNILGHCKNKELITLIGFGGIVENDCLFNVPDLEIIL